MKNVLIALFVPCTLWACAPAGHHDPSDHNGDHQMEVIHSEDFETEEEELEIPPDCALPLSEILASIEIANHTSITEVEFEGGVWDIDYVVGGKEYEILVDPMTGESLPEEPADLNDH